MKFNPYDFPCDEDELAEHAITQASWHGNIWQIGVGGTTLGNGARAVVCQMADEPLIWLTYTDSPERTSNSVQEVVIRDLTDSFGLRMTFAYAFGHEHWGRGFFLNNEFQLRRQGENACSFLLISPHGWASHRELALSTSIDPFNKDILFLWSFMDEKNYLRRLSASEIIEQFEVQVNNATSDFNFARTFAHLSDEERTNLVWPCARQNVPSMKRVLMWAFLAQNELWSSEDGLTWVVDLNGERGTIYPDDLVHLVDSPALEQARRSIFDFFQPHWDEGELQKHLCLRFFHRRTLSINAYNPTAHERLEAALNWRNWLQAHSPDEE